MDRFRRRRVTIVLIAAIVATACAGFGAWQLQRLEERRSLNAEIERHRSRDPLPLASGVGRGEVDPFIPVRASGEFDPEHEVLVYGRSLEGRPGHHLVTPLVFDDGSAVLVLRGWVPFRYQTAPVTEAAPPAGELTIRGFLVPDERNGRAVPGPSGVVERLDVRGIRSALPYPVLPLAIQLTGQAVPQPDEIPVPIPPPELSEGPHLSYAIQWFSFAAVAIVGAALLIRRDRREP